MTPQYEYEVIEFELIGKNIDFIKRYLNEMGRRGYSVVGCNHYGGFRSQKVVVYTLMKSANYRAVKSEIMTLESAINRMMPPEDEPPLPSSDTSEPLA